MTAKNFRFIQAFCQGFWRELERLSRNNFDLTMVMVMPLLIILLFGAMFYHGKAHHLPVAIIDQDNSTLSHLIYHRISHDETTNIVMVTDNLQQAHHAINRLDIGGVYPHSRWCRKSPCAWRESQYSYCLQSVIFQHR